MNWPQCNSTGQARAGAGNRVEERRRIPTIPPSVQRLLKMLQVLKVFIIISRRILLLVLAPLMQSDPSALAICHNHASLGEKQRSWSQAEMVMEYLAVHSFGSLQAVNVNTGRSGAQDDWTCCSVEA